MDTLSAVKYQGMRWNSPLSEQHADSLLDHLDLSNAKSLVDIGCGWGELLLRAAAKHALQTTGIDNDAVALSRGRKAAAERSLDTDFIQNTAEEWKGTADRAMCIGSSHALGGVQSMLSRLAEVVPHGKVLIGDGFWEKEPSKEAVDMLGDNISRLTDLVRMCRDAGWQVLHLSVADQREWDEFESSHRRGLREWILKNPQDSRVAEIQQQLAEREDGYLGVYRGMLGFAFLVIAR